MSRVWSAGETCDAVPGPSLMLGPDNLSDSCLSSRSRRHSSGRRRRGRAADDHRPPRARRETGEQRDERESESHRLHNRPPSFRNAWLFYEIALSLRATRASAGLRVHGRCQLPEPSANRWLRAHFSRGRPPARDNQARGADVGRQRGGGMDLYAVASRSREARDHAHRRPRAAGIRQERARGST